MWRLWRGVSGEVGGGCVVGGGEERGSGGVLFVIMA
jgi:hypothetical protein